MDIKQLKYLIALDQTRHFGQAAALCHITQPTLSMRIRNLEEELNLVLIQRGQRFEGFTAEGERILAWARALLAAHDGLEAEAAICRGQMVGQLRVGMVPLASLNPMQLIKPLAGKYPELQFSLLSLTSEQIIDGVSVISSIWAFATFTTSIASFSTLSGCRQREWGCCMINAIFSLPKGRQTGKRWPHYRLVFSLKECITVNPLR